MLRRAEATGTGTGTAGGTAAIAGGIGGAAGIAGAAREATAGPADVQGEGPGKMSGKTRSRAFNAAATCGAMAALTLVSVNERVVT